MIKLAKYTDEEIRAFQLKDILNCRFSALKAASINNESKGIDPELLKKEADSYYTWLRQDQDEVKSIEPKNESAKSKSEVLPEPTLVQKKVINAVCKDLGVDDGDDVRKRILSWVEKNYNKRVYPTKLESVSKIVNDLKGN